MMAYKSLADLNLWGVNRTQAVKHARKGIQILVKRRLRLSTNATCVTNFHFGTRQLLLLNLNKYP